MSTNQPTAAQPIDLDKRRCNCGKTVNECVVTPCHNYHDTGIDAELENYAALARQQPAASGAGEVAASIDIDSPDFMNAVAEFYEQASCEVFDKAAYGAARANLLAQLARQRQAVPHAQAEPVALTVWYGPMPESNGKSNFTAVLMRKDSMWNGPHVTIERSEYPDRIRYEADRVRYLIGELAEEPFILDYDADKHSSYAAPVPQEAEPTNTDMLQALVSAEKLLRAAGFAMKGTASSKIVAAITKHAQEAERAAPAAVTDALRNAILNLNCDPDKGEEYFDRRGAYIGGHMQARRSAAELIATQPAAPAVTDEAHTLNTSGFDVQKAAKVAHKAAPAVTDAAQGETAAAANLGSQSLPTEISERLRERATGGYTAVRTEDGALMLAAANEIERYYGAMMAWKQTAEKKDRDWNVERMARVNDRCEARAAVKGTDGQGGAA